MTDLRWNSTDPRMVVSANPLPPPETTFDASGTTAEHEVALNSFYVANPDAVPADGTGALINFRLDPTLDQWFRTIGSADQVYLHGALSLAHLDSINDILAKLHAENPFTKEVSDAMQAFSNTYNLRITVPRS